MLSSVASSLFVPLSVLVFEKQISVLYPMIVSVKSVFPPLFFISGVFSGSFHIFFVSQIRQRIWNCRKISWREAHSQPTQRCLWHHLLHHSCLFGWVFHERHICSDALRENLFHGPLVIVSFLIVAALINASFIVTVHVILALFANGLSMYLAYLLLYVIKSICVVCVGTYIINFLLLVFSALKLRRITRKLTKKAQKAEANKQKKAAKKNK